jgi:cardiolipin synthase
MSPTTSVRAGEVRGDPFFSGNVCITIYFLFIGASFNNLLKVSIPPRPETAGHYCSKSFQKKNPKAMMHPRKRFRSPIFNSIRARAHPGKAMSSVMTVANLLTILRLILIPVFVTAVYYQHFVGALAVFLAAAITDGLDGLVARSFNQKTQLGAILDPMADKMLLVTAFVILTLPGFPVIAPIPFWLTATTISRDVFIVLGAAVINMTTGFSGFRPSIPGKLNTFVQIATIVLFLTANAFDHFTRYLPVAFYATLGMAVFSGLHYILHANKLMSENP